jgi:glucose-fructose oxidoreductase
MIAYRLHFTDSQARAIELARSGKLGEPRTYQSGSFGAEPVEVTAMSATSDDPRFKEVDEMVSAVMRFPGDRLATFTCSFGAHDISNFQLVGTDAILHFEPAYDYTDDMADIRIISAIDEAARGGRSVKLKPFRKAKRPGPRQEIRRPPVKRQPDLVTVAAPDE